MRKALKEPLMTSHYPDDFALTTAARGSRAGLMGALARSASQEPAG